MSLKDRLKTTQKTPVKVEVEKQPQYFNTNDESNSFETLGVIDTLLIDEELNSVFVSGAKNVYLNKKGKIHKSTSTFRDNVQLENILKKAALAEGIEPIGENACFKFNHKIGVNVVATLPPLSNVATMFVKCYKDKHATFQTLQEEHSISKEIALVLEALCTIKKNILIVGEENTLKTTLLSALAKKIPTNNRTIIIDNEKELKIDFPNYTSYNFSNFKNNSMFDKLFKSIFLSNPDKIFVNDDEGNVILDALAYLNEGYKGFIATYKAKDEQDAIEKISKEYTSYDEKISKEEAKAMVLNSFDIIVCAKRDEIGRRKVSAISQINLLSQQEIVEQIFSLDYLQEHKSTGVVPIFYEDIKNNSLPIGDNIFDGNYKHTYYKGYNKDLTSQFGKKSPNIDILKKFKKELPMQEEVTEKEEENVQEKEIELLTGDDLMQKAQEKFNELKKNAQLQEEFNEAVEEFAQEENINEQQGENL